MSLWYSIKGFFEAFRAKSADDAGPGPLSSLARTMEESTHVRGGRGGLARASTEDQHEIVIEGHEDYVGSFEDDQEG